MVRSLGRVEIYFKLNRILLSLIGLWPYQTPRNSRLAMSVVLCLTISQLIPQFAGLLKVRQNFDAVIECLPPLGIAGLCVIKMINLATNNCKMKDLLDRIQKDFNSVISEQEIAIMERYGKHSLKLSKIYATIVYTAGTLFIIPPLLGASTPTLSPEMNETESQKRLPFIVDYHVDTDKYFYPIIVHSFMSTIAFVTVLVAADTIFVVYLQHGCAKFVALKYRLSQVTETGKLDVDIRPLEIDDLVYKKLQICVHLHEEAIEYAIAIESAYSISQLFQVGFCCLVMSLTGLQAARKLGKPDELMRYFGVIFSLMLELLFYSWPSHELMDQSVNVCEAIYNIEWYRVSIRTRKLVLQMMTRSLYTCKITAGKLHLMSMQNYCKILSNSMSYFTMLSSIQEQSTLRE